ncbi:MAG TPA: VIT domain-containing protein, partial [Anaerolineaceae bacterium]|nr:VIT domain-containing protein [Anaerolineaceae bacterium]
CPWTGWPSTYIFPLPLDAVVSEFTLWVDGQPVQGQVLSAEEARQTYQGIVSSLQDPALLEYVGQGALKASIFPIPSQGERRIELEYTQALTAENGLVRYTYPLNTEKFSLAPLESVSVTVSVQDPQSIRAVYSPSHTVDIQRPDQNSARISYEGTNVLPDTDFSLYYSLGEQQAFHLFSYRTPNDPQDADGFFMLLLAPNPKSIDQVIDKDILLVLDRSGSMEGEKFIQAQTAARFILENLNPGDRFYVTSFSSGIDTYANDLRPASEAGSAVAWLNRQSAAGSTDINLALLDTAAVADRERPTYLIFLTDGLPTEGEINSASILDNFSRTAPANLRLFAFGVGYDVDTYLLDSLSQNHQGLSTYVKPGEALDEILSAFYARISTPVLTNLQLDFGPLSVYDLYPNPLPDLFRGSQVVVVGRYRDGGTVDVTLTGEVNGELMRFTYADQVFARDTTGQRGPITGLPRLWATRKIGYLLNQIRLRGVDEETVAQIVRLSIRYGIVTPYTSYLVTEPQLLGSANQDEVVREAYNDLLAQPTQVSGEAAVNKAADQGAMSAAEAPPAVAVESGVSAAPIRIAGDHTFIQQDGVWLDTTYDPQTMTTIKVGFLSEDYFRLADSRPDVAAALALGDRVILMVDGTAYEVTTEAVSGDVPLPDPATPLTATDTGPVPVVGVTEVVDPLPNPQPPAIPGKGLCPAMLIPLGAVVALAVRRRSTAANS